MEVSTQPGPQLWVVRHGQTTWSRDGRHTSVTDLPLTEEGERVAAGLRPRLAEVDFAAVLTSPRLRARRTAELAGFPAAVTDEDLAEWDYGDYEGITTEEIRETVPDWTVWTRPSPGGEDAAQVTRRLDRVVERVRDTGGNVLVFSHGHAGRALAARWIGQPVDEGRFWALDTATVSILGVDRGIPVVRLWNS